MTAILTFENTEFDVVDVRNVPWLRGLQVASALGYEDASDSIQKLFSRNADEFTDEMTQVLDLPTAGGVQPVRIFSPRGCYLLGMLARTDRAKLFRQWVLDVLEGRALPHQAKPATVSQQIALHRLRMALTEKLERATAEGVRKATYQQLRHVSRLLAIACPPLDEVGRTVHQAELPGV